MDYFSDVAKYIVLLTDLAFISVGVWYCSRKYERMDCMDFVGVAVVLTIIVGCLTASIYKGLLN